MTSLPLLVPAPRQLAMTGGTITLGSEPLIILNASRPQGLRFGAERVRQAIAQATGSSWQIAASSHVPPARVGLRLNLFPGATRHPQGYELTITPEVIGIVAATPTGIWYGCLTLAQLVARYGATLPCLHIEDWPDYPNRGVMLDISRDKVPTMETLYALIDRLASWKINQVQLYMEHTFAYQHHPQVWAEASPMTGEQVLALDAFCRERFIELVPNQNTFGHMYRWLRLERYLPLAEVTEGAPTPWGFYWEGPYSLSPNHPGSLDLVRDMLDELLPHFHSQQVNVGCDETFDLGYGQSSTLVESRGVGRVYLDFLLQIYREVKARGHTMQFWGDIIMAHPDLVPELPRDAIAMEWGYEADHPFDDHGALFARSGIPFYVCAGTSSWRSLAGRTDNALGNLRNAATNGMNYGATGMLITDWGDQGHWQPLPVSYAGFVTGAALSWGLHNADMDVAAALNLYGFDDTAGHMGQIAFDLGNVYQLPGILTENSSVLFNALQATPEEICQDILAEVEPDALRRHLMVTQDRIDAIMAQMPDTRMVSKDAELIQREYLWVADMLRHASRRILWVLDGNVSVTAEDLFIDGAGLLNRYEDIWHARNRPGGFKDSRARMQTMISTYEIPISGAG